jgi:CRISPR-associated endonuclease/helicase Cas3
MRLIRTIDTKPESDDDEERGERRFWRWYERPASADNEGSVSAQYPVRWDPHTKQVTENARRIVTKLKLPQESQEAVVLAAKWHDLGKRRELWQRSIGNPKPTDWHAKSGKGWRPREITDYRHEFGSLLDVLDEREFRALKDKPELQDLVLHLIAAHHGRGRPHFRPGEGFDPQPNGKDVGVIACQVPQRFARLQRKYGRWGLAYLESLLRAADWAASANASATREDVR